MAVHVLARIMVCHREMVSNRTPRKPMCRLPADQRHGVPELHVHMQAGSAESGVVIAIGLISECFVVSQASLANQRRLGAKQPNQTARVPPHQMKLVGTLLTGARVSRTGCWTLCRQGA